MRKNPHVRICGGLGSATTLVYPTAPAALYAFHVAVVRVPVAVQLMHTSPAALSSFSWPHEHRSAA